MQALKQYQGKEVHGLEIGSFEGRSAIWFFDNILTHPSATMTCVDVFPKEYEDTFDKNIEVSGYSKRVVKKKGLSSQVLRTLKPNYEFFDIDNFIVHKKPGKNQKCGSTNKGCLKIIKVGEYYLRCKTFLPDDEFRRRFGKLL
jgi:hypothetical protein